jgi:NTE family protein
MTAHANPSPIQARSVVAGQKLVNLAIQGVGAHGAFTWGVLDRLLEEERLAFDGISATSAGAVNTVVLAYGLTVGGREGAKRTLDRYWRRLSAMTSTSIFQPSFFDKIYGNFGLDHSPGYVFVDALSQVFSPYQLNPLNYNPFKKLLEETVDFEVLRRQSAIKLFLCATNVRSGKVKIFPSEELRADHVVASSCQPLTMHAVEIDGEYYWDGGFMGNPALFPLIYACDARDIILVHLTPIERWENPTTSRAILSRMQEVTFNSSVMREMRVVAFVTKLIDDGKIVDGKRILLHMIDGEDIIGALSNSSKLNGDWDFVQHLYRIGRERADEWLQSNFDRLGVQTTIDLQSKYL